MKWEKVVPGEKGRNEERTDEEKNMCLEECLQCYP